MLLYVLMYSILKMIWQSIITEKTHGLNSNDLNNRLKAIELNLEHLDLDNQNQIMKTDYLNARSNQTTAVLNELIDQLLGLDLQKKRIKFFDYNYNV